LTLGITGTPQNGARMSGGENSALVGAASQAKVMARG
jgi:hypothetical protein